MKAPGTAKRTVFLFLVIEETVTVSMSSLGWTKVRTVSGRVSPTEMVAEILVVVEESLRGLGWGRSLKGFR